MKCPNCDGIMEIVAESNNSSTAEALSTDPNVFAPAHAAMWHCQNPQCGYHEWRTK